MDIAIIELPESWELASLESILLELEIGSRPKGGVQNIRDGVPSLGGEHLAIFGGFNFNKIKYVPEEFAEKQNRGWIQPSDILIVKDGATTGKTSFVGKTFPYKKALINEHVFRCKVANGISPEYVFMFLVSDAGTKEILKDFRGAAQGGISRNFANLATLPLAPTNEQKRISLKIGTLRSHGSKARKALEAIPPLLENFRQSVLSSAFRGDLTADRRAQNPDIEPAEKLLERIRKERRKRWEEAELAKMKAKGKMPKDDKWKDKYKEPEPVDTSDLPELPEGWCWAKVSQIAESALGKMLDRSKHTTGTKLQYLRNINVRWGFVDISDLLTMFFKEGEIERYSLAEGDVLICEGGEPGRSAVWTRKGKSQLMYQKALHRVRIFQPLLPWWIVYYLWNDALNGNLDDFFTGTTIKHFTGKMLARYPVPIAPLEEQKSILQKLHESFEGLKNIQEQISISLEKVNAMDQSILSKAFRGELVPQDPNDEPASQLLEQIKLEKTSLEAGKKQRGKAERKKGIRKKKQLQWQRKKNVVLWLMFCNRIRPDCPRKSFFSKPVLTSILWMSFT